MPRDSTGIDWVRRYTDLPRNRPVELAILSILEDCPRRMYDLRASVSKTTDTYGTEITRTNLCNIVTRMITKGWIEAKWPDRFRMFWITEAGLRILDDARRQAKAANRP